MIALAGSTWDHPRGYTPLDAAAHMFRGEGRVDLRWTRRSLQAFADQPLAALAADHDLLVIDHPHLGEAIAAGALLPLDAPERTVALDRLAVESVGPSHASYAMHGRQWALAIDAAAQVSAWRPDRLDRPPETWDAAVALAETGGVVMPLKPVDAIDAVLTLAANLGDPARDDQWLQRGTARAVLDGLAAIARHVPPACLDQDPINVLEALSADGDARYCPLLFGYTNYARAGFRAARVRFADLPALGNAGPVGSILGGAGIAVSAASRHADAAIEIAFRIAGGEFQAGPYVRAGGQPGNRTAWEDPALDRLCGGFFADTARTLAAAWVRPRHAGFLRFADKGGELVNTFLRGLIDRETTLDLLESAYAASLPERLAA